MAATPSDSMFTALEDTTVNLLAAAATRLTAATVCKCFWFDTTKDSAIYYKSAGQAADLRHLLTLDESYDSTTSILSLKMLTAGWIGISDTAGRITFTDAATELIEVDNAIFEFNPDNGSFNFILNANALANAFFMQGTTGRIFLNSNGTPESAIEIDDDAGGADNGGICLQELSANHAAPSADKVVIFAKENAGKTTLYAIFNGGGAAQSIAVQP